MRCMPLSPVKTHGTLLTDDELKDDELKDDELKDDELKDDELKDEFSHQYSRLLTSGVYVSSMCGSLALTYGIDITMRCQSDSR